MTSHAFYVTTQVHDMNVPWILSHLRETYFGRDRTEEQLYEQIRNSIPFAIKRRDYVDEAGHSTGNDSHVGFCRVVTDRVAFGWLCDFVIAPEFRGKGAGSHLMAVVMNHHELRCVNMNLGTRDAQPFYRKFGFEEGTHMLRRPKKE